MKSDKKTYTKVAKECSEYSPCHCNDSYKAVVGDCNCDSPSCLNCSHFAPEEYCRLDLYDKIIKNI